MGNSKLLNLPPFVESNLQGIIIFHNGRNIYANNKASEILNYTKEEILKFDLDCIYSKIYPLDLKTVKHFINLFETNLDFEERIEYRFKTKKNIYRWYRVIAKSLQHKGDRFVIQNIEDITSNKEYELKLVENESRYRNFIEQTSEGISYLKFKDPINISEKIEKQIELIYKTGYISECNNALAKMYGFKDSNEIIGKYLIEIHGSDNNEINIIAFKDFVENNYVVKNALTEELNSENKKKYFLNNSVGVIKDGFLTGIWGTQIDITEKQKTERNMTAAYKISEAIHNSKDFNEMYSIIHSIVSTLMPANNFYIAIYDNVNDLITFPYFVDEVDEIAYSRKPGNGITEFVLKTGKPLLATPEVINELREKGESLLYGSESIDWLGVPLKTKTRTFGVIAVQSYTEGIRYSESDLEILEFVSEQVAMAYERKSSEESLIFSESKNRAILSAIPDLMFVQSFDGVYLEYHARNSDLLLLKPEEFIGKNYKDVLPKHLVKLFREVIKETIETNNIQLCKYPLIIKNEQHHFEARFVPFDNNKILSTIRDITLQEQMMDELINAKEKAEEMNMIKTNFLANMSHELRTPLHGIIGFSQLLTDEINDEEFKNMASVIYKSANRLLETLNLILNFSKIESNKIELNFSLINLELFIREIIDLFKPMADSKNLSIKFEIKNDLINYFSDERILREILYNLINNAIKFTSKGYIKISINKENDEIIIKVKDTGIGIPENKFGLIFEEFRQESEGLNRNFEGTGLGLTLTRRNVELLNGEIFLESKIGQGTTFTIILPDKKHNEDNKVDFDDTDKSPKISIVPAPSSKKNILLVENDKVSAMLVKTFLKNDYKLDIVISGDLALQKAAENAYDAILMDINLGIGMTGLDAAQKIKLLKKYKNIPIIAVTAFAMEKDKEEFLKFGCTHYIAKPFDKNDLLKLLNTIFRKQDNI